MRSMAFPRRRAASPVPAAFPVQPSRQFQGNDGAWSTFAITAGNASKQFDSLISTSSFISWLASDQGCNSANDQTVPSNCAKLRGSTTSTGWQAGDDSVGQYAMVFGSGFPPNQIFGISPAASNYTSETYNSASTVDRDSIILEPNTAGGSGIRANCSLIFSLLDYSYFIGSLGIRPGFIQLDQNPKKFPSLLENLVNTSVIATRTWGYTAGAYYNQSFGSLVLGGYDTYRFTSPTYNFHMPIVSEISGDPQIQVSVTSIIVKHPDGTTQSMTTSNGTTTEFNAIVDSTLPYLYLPQAVCDSFASTFGLNFDNNSQLYTLNSSQRGTNQDLQVQIIVADTTKNLDVHQTITLPYAAFDLNASWPIYDDPVPYFPIRRSPDDSKNLFVLGRTFLQEAYIIADFDNNNFTVAKALTSSSGVQNIVTILPNGERVPGSGGLSRGAIAGIVIGVLAALSLVCLLAWYFLRKKRKAQKKESSVESTPDQQHTVLDEKDDRVLPSPAVDAETYSGPPEIDGCPRPTLHQRNMSELSGGSGRTASELPSDTDTCRNTLGSLAEAEGDAGVRRFELEGKNDTEAWARNQERVMREGTPRQELPGDYPLGWIRPRSPRHRSSSSAASSQPSPGGSSPSANTQGQDRSPSFGTASTRRRPVPTPTLEAVNPVPLEDDRAEPAGDVERTNTSEHRGDRVEER